MKKVYVVMGSTGEYSDRHEWAVRAYLDEDAAEAAVRLAECWAVKNGVSMSQEAAMPDWDEREKIGKQCPIGPADIDYTGVRWCVMPVPLEDGR